MDNTLIKVELTVEKCHALISLSDTNAEISRVTTYTQNAIENLVKNGGDSLETSLDILANAEREQAIEKVALNQSQYTELLEELDMF